MKTQKFKNTMAGRLPASLLIAVITIILAFGSCRKKEREPEEKDTEQAMAAENNFAEGLVSDVDAIGSQASENNELSGYKLNAGSFSATNVLTVAPCATITSAPAARIFTVDFGTGCTGKDGRVRKGKLVYDCSASDAGATYYRNPGFVMNISSVNYVVDGNQVNIISKSIKNTSPANLPQGSQPGVNLTWLATANISIIKSGGGSIQWSCDRTKELVNTSDTNCYRGQLRPIRWDMAVVKLNGGATGTNSKGETFSAIATGLVRDFTCSPDVIHPRRHPFVSGTIAYTPGSRPTRLVDFGNGSCDLNATVTINGNTYNIVLQ